MRVLTNPDGDEGAEAELFKVIRQYCEPIKQPDMSRAVLHLLLSKNEYAGHQAPHQRGTHQMRGRHGLDSFILEGGELGSFLSDVRADATPGGGRLINHFLNINRGGVEAPQHDLAASPENVCASHVCTRMPARTVHTHGMTRLYAAQPERARALSPPCWITHIAF